MLTKTLPKPIVSNDITLNFLPDSHPHIPAVVGRVPYNTTVKLLQFLVTTLLLPPTSKLMILTARTDSLSAITRYSYYRTHDHPKSKDADTTTHDEEQTDHPHHHQQHAHHRHHPHSKETSASSMGVPPRFIVYWRTVSPEDYDVKTRKDEATNTEYFPYSWSSSLAKEMDPVQIARSIGILPHEYPVLTGIFEFEFDETCTSVITHTITDLEYLTKPTTECINPA